jgi:hypothetical protein
LNEKINERRKALLADLSRRHSRRDRVQSAFRGRRGDRLRARLRARLRKDRLEAAQFAVPGWPRRPLAQGQEPVGACGTTRGRGGLRTSDGRPDDERRDDQAIAPFITLVGVARRAVVNDGDDTPECGYQAVEYLSQVETCSWSRSSSSANKACLFRNISRSQK